MQSPKVTDGVFLLGEVGGYNYKWIDFNIFDIFQKIVAMILFVTQVSPSLVNENSFILAPVSFDMSIVVSDSFHAS